MWAPAISTLPPIRTVSGNPVRPIGRGGIARQSNGRASQCSASPTMKLASSPTPPSPPLLQTLTPLDRLLLDDMDGMALGDCTSADSAQQPQVIDLTQSPSPPPVANTIAAMGSGFPMIAIDIADLCQTSSPPRPQIPQYSAPPPPPIVTRAYTQPMSSPYDGSRPPSVNVPQPSSLLVSSSAFAPSRTRTISAAASSAMSSASSTACSDFMSFVERGRMGVQATFSPQFDVPGFSEPIGCAYAEVPHSRYASEGITQGRYIVCDTLANKVVIFVDSANGRRPSRPQLVPGTFVKPSAVALSSCMTAFAIKDDHSIRVCSVTDGAFICYVVRCARGEKLLGLGTFLDPASDEEKVCTMVQRQSEYWLVIYNVQKPDVNIIYREWSYKSLLDKARHVDGQPIDLTTPNRPCFMTCRGTTIAITDLNTNLVLVIDGLTGEPKVAFGRPASSPPFGRPSPPPSPDRFAYVSGIRMDDYGNMLIGDAKGRRVVLYDASGRFVTVVRGIRPVFVTDLHVTADGRLIILERHGKDNNCHLLVGKLGHA